MVIGTKEAEVSVGRVFLQDMARTFNVYEAFLSRASGRSSLRSRLLTDSAEGQQQIDADMADFKPLELPPLPEDLKECEGGINDSNKER